MKRLFLLLTTLFQLTFSYGQQWSNWVRATCNQGIQGSAINYGYNQYGKGYEWNWKVKNTYTKTVTFDLYFKVGNDKKSWGVFTLAPGEERKHVSFYYNDASPSFLITVENVFFGTLSEPNSKRCWAECDNGSPICNVKGGQNTLNQSTTQQNDPIFERNNASFQDYYKRATSAGQAGNYDEAISLWNSAISVAVNNVQKENAQSWLAEAEKAKANATNNNIQKQQELQRQQQKQQQEKEKQQQLQQGINQLTTATSDLVTLLTSRKRTSKSSLSNEDVQVLIGIVNSETPLNYAQNVIDIFSDLGYTFKSSEMMNYGGLFISMYDNSTIQWPLTITIDPASKYDPYSKINFDYQRKDRLKNQLSKLGDNLVAFTIKGISPTRQKLELDINLAKKQQENEALKTISDAGVEIPIQTNKIITENITVKSIIDNYIIATGGSENIKAVETITQIDDHKGNLRKSITGYGKFFQEETFKDRKFKFVFNGTNGYAGYNGEKEPLSKEAILRQQKIKPFPILDLEQSKLTIGKIEKIKGVEYYTIIEPSTQSGNLKTSITRFFEVESGLYKGYKIEFSSPNYNATSYTFYGDFREVEHITLPFSAISFSSNDKKSVDRTIVKEIKINEPNISFE